MKSYSQHLRETISLSIPVSVGQLGFVMMGVVDSIMVGHNGAESLAASSLGSGVFILFLVLGLGISYAISPLVSIALGSNNEELLGDIFRQSLVINLLTGVILSLFVFGFSYAIPYLNQPPEVSKLAQSYIKILGISIIPTMIFQSYKQFIEGFSFMRPAMVIAIVANFVNAFINWLLIYGNWGMPKLGLDGAGYATLASRLFMTTAMIYITANHRRFSSIRLSLLPYSVNKELIKKILSVGVPSGVQYFFEVGAFVSAAYIVGWLGTEQLAAHTIALNISAISYMVTLGLSSAGAIRVGYEVGRKDVIETRKAGFSALIMAVLFMAVSAVILILFRDQLVHIFTSESVVIAVAADLLIVAAFFQIFDGSQAVGIGICRGLTDVTVPTYITFFAYWIVGLPIGYVLGFWANWGVIGVWVGLSLGLITSAVLLNTRFTFKSKKIIAVYK